MRRPLRSLQALCQQLLSFGPTNRDRALDSVVGEQSARFFLLLIFSLFHFSLFHVEFSLLIVCYNIYSYRVVVQDYLTTNDYKLAVPSPLDAIILDGTAAETARVL